MAVVGTSPTMVEQMRKVATKAIKPRGKKACPTTSLDWSAGSSRNPEVFTYTNQIKMWIQLWDNVKGNADSKVRAARTWVKLHQAFRQDDPVDSCRNTSKSSEVIRPIGATILSLLQLGWKLYKPWLWRDNTGEKEAHIG